MSACEFCGVDHDREDALAEHSHEITKLTAALAAEKEANRKAIEWTRDLDRQIVDLTRRAEAAERSRDFEADHRDFANSCCSDDVCREGACCNSPEYGECRKCLRARAALRDEESETPGSERP